MMRQIFIFLVFVTFLASCEKEFTPAISSAPPDLVVEGYIEAGDNPLPAYVMLTKSQPFFGELDSSAFADIYVHDAVVTVTNNGTVYPLTEICLQDLTPAQKAIISQSLGFDPDSLQADICFYLDITFQLQGQEGER
ncbi:MAG TPA: DUF4249 family protein, partial [Saprospiraceae bacterium]|nr:DUF4249 family protein [Saprospiraceae bacterium]